RCSIFVPKGDVLVPAMSQLATGATRADLWQAFTALETKVGPEGPAIVLEVLAARRPRVVLNVPTVPRVPDEWKPFGIRSLHAVRADSAGIYLMTETRDRMLPYAAYHMPKEILDTIRKRPILLKHFEDLQTHWSADVPNDPAFQAPIFRQFPAKSLILAPLRA